MTEHQQAATAQWRPVHKFGGSSLADAAGFHRVANIINAQQADALIVVSASGKTTNRLIELLNLFISGDDAAAIVLEGIYSYQQQLICNVLSDDVAAPLLAELERDISDIASLLEHQKLDLYQRNKVQSYGEVWSARLLAHLLNSQGRGATPIDARQFLQVSGTPVKVEHAYSSAHLNALLNQYQGQCLVITGFIAADGQGQTRLLGRNGSDFTATLVAELAGSSHTTIWSDVPGVFSADPRRVTAAQLLERMSLAEANELARLGSPVLHNRTLGPVADSQQQLMLRSSYHPDDGYTRILRHQQREPGARVVTSIDDAVLIEMSINDRYQERVDALTAWLTERELAPLACKRRPERKLWQIAYTQEQVDQVFALLCDHQPAGGFEDLQQREGFSLVALVGNGVTAQAEQCLHFYHALNEQPLEFIQPAKNGLSLVGVLRKVVLEPLLLRLHQSLFSRPKRVGLILFGRGNIGQSWLTLFQEQQARLEKSLNLQVTLYAAFNSHGAMFDSAGLTREQIISDFEPSPLSWSSWLEGVTEHGFDHLIAIDMTASEQLAQRYPDLIAQHIHIIAANKLAVAAEQESYQTLKQHLVEQDVQLLSNATVGAGLPVQTSIKQLQYSGEQIQRIGGIFSGTLSWLFQQYDGSQPFSQLVQQAYQQGLTEPDPRADLSGQDVQRKLVILAREAGFALDPLAVHVENLVPATLAKLDRDSFFKRLSELDAPLAAAQAKAQQQGGVLRYLAQFDAATGEARVGLEVVDKDDAVAHVKAGDNVFVIHTTHYHDNPLIIQGPGAGREVTAGAVQADLWKLLASL